jgi:ABC-2 type transport system ATP-binding protein
MSALPSTGLAAETPLSCERVGKSYGYDRVLREIHVQLERGEVLGLIGRNGAGKTTLIRILLGLLQPDRGSARVFGEPSLSLSDGAKARIGYVSQQPDALAWMRVGDMLDFVGRQYPRWDAAFVETFLLRWELPSAQPLAKLSPGERQRVAIIRALAVRPELLVLDEPAAALDPVARRQVMREIVARAGDAGTTVLFSTHIVSDLERVASRVVFLHDARVIIDAPLDTLAETHARVLIPAEARAQLPPRLQGELSRHPKYDGSLSVVIRRQSGVPWPEITQLPGVRLDALSLEDLFIEVAG